jgi:hypothetical protein
MAAFEPVFSILDRPCPYWMSAIPIASIGIAFGLLSPPMMRRASASGSKRRARAVAAGFLVNGLVWATVAIVSIAECASLKSVLRAGRATVVEGTVEDFHPLTVPSNKDESFRVGRHVFRYSDYNLSSGFGKTVSQGGPVREGLNVRVFYVGNTILKLEIWR